MSRQWYMDNRESLLVGYQHRYDNDREFRTSRLAYTRKRRMDRLAYIDSLKTGGCVDCGNKNITVLDFDHLRDKEYGVSSMSTMTFAKIDAEVAKCEIRCANCHRIKTLAWRRGRV